MLLEKTPNHSITTVIIQTDSAGGHGGGRGSGMKKSLDEVNKYAEEKTSGKQVSPYSFLSFLLPVYN
jgi:hypothetical protein